MPLDLSYDPSWKPAEANPKAGPDLSYDPNWKPPAPPTMAGEFKKGFAGGVDALQGAGYGLAALAGDAAGLEGVKQWGLAGYQRNQQEQQANAPAVGRFEDIGGLKDAGLYAAQGLGQLAPFALSSVATGGLGGLAGRVLTQGAAKQAGERLLAEKAGEIAAGNMTKDAAGKLAQDAAGKVLTKGMERGALAGAAANSIGTEQGMIYGDIYEQTGQTAPGTAALYGLGAGLLDVIPEAGLIRKVAGSQATKGIVREALGQAGKEAATEGAQTVVERGAVANVDPSKEVFSPEGMSEIANAAVLGGLGGGVVGAGGRLLAGRGRQEGEPIAPAPEQAQAGQAADAGLQPVAPAAPIPAIDPDAGPLSRAAIQAQPIGAAPVPQAPIQTATAQSQQGATDPFADRLATVESRMTPERLAAVQAEPGFGADMVQQLHNAAQIAGNWANARPEIRERALAGLEDFWSRFDSRWAPPNAPEQSTAVVPAWPQMQIDPNTLRGEARDVTPAGELPAPTRQQVQPALLAAKTGEGFTVDAGGTARPTLAPSFGEAYGGAERSLPVVAGQWRSIPVRSFDTAQRKAQEMSQSKGEPYAVAQHPKVAGAFAVVPKRLIQPEQANGPIVGQAATQVATQGGQARPDELRGGAADVGARPGGQPGDGANAGMPAPGMRADVAVRGAGAGGGVAPTGNQEARGGPPMTAAEQPGERHAPQEIGQQEGISGQREGGDRGRQAAEAGGGDRLLGAAGGPEQGQTPIGRGQAQAQGQALNGLPAAQPLAGQAGAAQGQEGAAQSGLTEQHYADRWNAMTPEQRMAASMKAGWTTANGGPNFVAKRHAKTTWEAIPENSRQTIIAKSGGFFAAEKAIPKPTKPAAPRQTVGEDDAQRLTRATEHAEDLRNMAQDAGWAEQGGRLLRDAAGNVSRSKWLPRAEWFRAGMIAQPDAVRTAVDKAADGKRLTAKESRTVAGMVEWLEAQQQGRRLDENSSAYDFERASYNDLTEATKHAKDSLDAFLAETETSEADAMRALGFTEEEIHEATGARSTEQGEAGARQAESGGTQESGAVPGEAFRLESPTEAELRANQESLAAQQQREAEAQRQADEKAQADRERDSYTLTGSDRAADANPGQGGLFDQSPPKVEQRTKRDAYTRDIFDHPLPAEPEVRAAPSEQQRATENRDILAAGAVPGAQFATVAGPRKTGEVRSGVTHVRSAVDAAHVLAGMRKLPQEAFAVLVLDKDSKPISVLRLFKGATSQASVYPEVVTKAVYETPGAASIWYAHNHPSGAAEQSRADEVLTIALSQAFGTGTGITVRGHVIIAGTRAVELNADGDRQGRSFPIKPGLRTNAIPITERVFRKVGALGAEIGSPQTAEREISRISGGATGVVFANSQNAPVAFLPLSLEQMQKLRDGESARLLFGAAARSNATAAFINFSDGVQSDEAKAAVTNLYNALSVKRDVRVLDYFVGGQSQLSRGMALGDEGRSGTFFSRSSRGAGQRNAEISRFLNGSPIVDLPGGKAPKGGFAELRRWAAGIFAAHGNSATNPEIGAVRMDMRSVRDSIGHSMSSLKAEAFAAVPDVIERGRVVLIESRSEDADSIYISAPVRISGTDEIVTALVHRDVNTQRMYLHSVIAKESLLDTRVSGASVLPPKHSGSSHQGGIDTVLRDLLNFNADDRFSRSDRGAGMPLRDVQAVVDRVSKRMKNLPRVHVLESPASLSTKDPTQKALRDSIRAQDAWNDVEGAHHDGEIYLFASNLANEAKAEHVLAIHEVTHYGLRGAVGKDLDSALQAVWLTNPAVREAARAVKERTGIKSNVEAVEEVLADMPTADLVKLKGWRKVVQAVRNWLARIGATGMARRLTKLMMSGLDQQSQADVMVADLVNAARDWVRNGKQPDSLAAGTMFSFAGQNALTADRFALASAQDRLARGEDAETVRQETGWHRDQHDGKWKFEISDRDAELYGSEGSHFGDILMGGDTLAEVMSHPKLFAAYPQLRDVKVDTLPADSKSLGNFNVASNTIRIRENLTLDKALSAILHEAQHFVQREEEGFATGSNLRDAGSHGAYWNSAGEVEARNVQTRQKMTDEDRQGLAPRLTTDVHDNDVIVSWNGKEMASERGNPADPNAAKLARVDRELHRLEDDMRPVRGSDQAKAVRQEIVGKPLTNIETGMVATVSGMSFGKMLSKSNVDLSVSPQAHYQALGNLDKLFRLATEREARDSKKAPGTISAIHHFDVPMPFDGDVLLVKIMAKEFRSQQEGTRLYLVQAVEIEAPAAKLVQRLLGSQDESEHTPRAAGTSTPRLAQMIAAVKGDGSDTRFSRAGQSAATVANAARQWAGGIFGRQNPPAAPAAPSSGATWASPVPSKMDDVIYAMQDKQVDMRRVVGAIRQAVGAIADKWNPYLGEELFHGRSAKGVKDFLDLELRPLLMEMRMRGVEMSDFEEYLWNRHAEERNQQIASINPQMQDGGSGLKTADAHAYLAALPVDKRKAYESLAKRIDAINAKTRQVLVDSGLEKQSTIDAWQNAYQHYVPLQREDVETGGNGTGQGFSIRGSASKRAVGSNKPVADILANIAQQRERTVVRAEKNRVSNALFGLAMSQPNPEFWKVDEAPTERVVEKVGGQDQVVERVVPGFRSRDNVVLTRINGEDHYVIFNEQEPRALRMAQALKNLDADQLGRVLSAAGKATRYFASINTQFNPIFGIINLIRDTQGALLNLSTTPIRGEQKKVLGYTVDALRGIYADVRAHRAGQVPTSAWAQLWEEFQKEGGQTGYRDQYANAEARAEAILTELRRAGEGKAKHFGRAVFGWLSDYNETMENAVRLAAYRTAKEQGLSNAQAASVAKNLTVNFNRKGQVATQVGALYAFFNASVQGTARLAETLAGPMGRKIVTGGLLLGAMQALLLAAADMGDDEPPEFVRERNMILPIGGGKYLTLPMPLGFHVLPNLGRIPMEFAMSGFKAPARRIADLFGLFADTFNPIGNAGISLQTIAPTVVDPFAALAENRDWTGKTITRADMNPLSPTPGHSRAKDTATTWSKAIAYGINWLSGGTEFKAGIVSPTPDQIDYLIGQATGGVGREAAKLEQTVSAALSGEDMPLYKVPLVGRFVGDTTGQSAEGGKFYEAIKRINEHENELKGLRAQGRVNEAREYLQDNPEARLVMAGNYIEREMQKLRKAKRQAVESGDTEGVKSLDQQITSRMRQFNERVALLQ